MGPIRFCAVSGARLPHSLLVRFAAFEVPEHLQNQIREPIPSPKSKRGAGIINDTKESLSKLAILPLESSDRRSGATSYHVLKRQYLELTEKRRKFGALRTRIMRSFSADGKECLWQNDMATLVERRLRLRVEKALGLVSDGIYTDLSAAEAHGRVLAILSWDSIPDSKNSGRFKDSEFVLSTTFKTPIIKYFVNRVCGYDTASTIKRVLSEFIAPECKESSLKELIIIATPSTRQLLTQLWLLRLYIEDRKELS